jgi:hypothetical protein
MLSFSLKKKLCQGSGSGSMQPLQECSREDMLNGIGHTRASLWERSMVCGRESIQGSHQRWPRRGPVSRCSGYSTAGLVVQQVLLAAHTRDQVCVSVEEWLLVSFSKSVTVGGRPRGQRWQGGAADVGVSDVCDERGNRLAMTSTSHSAISTACTTELLAACM